MGGRELFGVRLVSAEEIGLGVAVMRGVYRCALVNESKEGGEVERGKGRSRNSEGVV